MPDRTRAIKPLMPANTWFPFDPLLTDAQARGMLDLCERYGSYKMYSEEPTFEGIGQGLPARWDAARNFIRSGGRFGRSEDLHVLAARTNYFRETYAYGDEIRIDGIQPFLRHEGFVEAARRLHRRPVIVPAIVYANLLVPGQELAVHTDVPEFRGVSRKTHPQWLLVAMRHSRFFEDWRMPIATGVSWYHDSRGGEFAFYPDGPEAAPVALPVRFNTAVLLDTDTVFHGVDRVASEKGDVAPLEPGMRLAFAGAGEWCIVDGEREVARYRWDDLRFSISWKAYCFRDETERRLWSEHSDDLTVDVVVDRLVRDLRDKGKLGASLPEDRELVDVIIDEYIRYPAPASACVPAIGAAKVSSRAIR